MLDSSDFLFVNHHGSIAEALLHRSLIALREEIHEPSSDILGQKICIFAENFFKYGKDTNKI